MSDRVEHGPSEKAREIAIFDGPPMITAVRDNLRRDGEVQWHATTAKKNPLAVTLSSVQARGVARALDTLGEWRVAALLRKAADHVEAPSRDS